VALELKCSCCGEDAIGVCNCMLQQPVSEAYCASCLEKGIDAWWIVLNVVALCTEGVDASTWREAIAPWAVGVIERSLEFYKKTEEQMLSEVRAMENGASNEPGPTAEG